MDLKKNRLFVASIILVAIISFVIGVAVSVSTPAENSVPVYDGVDTWNSSGDENSGILIIKDSNTVCFPNGGNCDINIVWDGTDMTING
mgnify:FL=1